MIIKEYLRAIGNKCLEQIILSHDAFRTLKILFQRLYNTFVGCKFKIQSFCTDPFCYIIIRRTESAGGYDYIISFKRCFKTFFKAFCIISADGMMQHVYAVIRQHL